MMCIPTKSAGDVHPHNVIRDVTSRVKFLRTIFGYSPYYSEESHQFYTFQFTLDSQTTFEMCFSMEILLAVPACRCPGSTGCNCGRCFGCSDIGLTLCDGKCVDTRSDGSNCGACGGV
jgi:hypothetical protein